MSATSSSAPLFSGIGPFRGRAPDQLSESERIVLSHFFTSIDSNVYAATDQMPNRIWALMMGQYARSDMTAKERFLKLIRDTHEKSSAPSVDQLADLISRNRDLTDALSGAMAKAGKFIEEWGVNYGHASLRDSDIIRMCFEGASQRATKLLELAREAAYQEQSTRALPPDAEHLGIPPEVRGTRYDRDLRELHRLTHGVYALAMERGKPHFNEKFAHLRREADERVRERLHDPAAKLPDGKWNGVIDAKAFDIARYMILSAQTTSLGVTMNTRRFQDMLTYWQSLPNEEMRLLGAKAQQEALKISPDLMKYGSASEFLMEQPARIGAVYDELVTLSEPEFRHYDVNSTLMTSTPDLEDMVLASVLFSARGNQLSFAELQGQVSRMQAGDRRKIAKALMDGMGQHDLYPKQAEVGSVVFERLYDIGAFRDLQRQRGDRQQVGPYTVIGYSMPPEFRELGLESEFVAAMHAVRDLHKDVAKNLSPFVAEYFTAMANVIRHVVTKDPVQQFYEAGLRAQAAGIDSYRTVALQETRATLDLLPAFDGLVRCDWTPKYDLGRLDETVNGYVRQEQKKRK